MNSCSIFRPTIFKAGQAAHPAFTDPPRGRSGRPRPHLSVARAALPIWFRQTAARPPVLPRATLSRFVPIRAHNAR